MGVRSFFGGVVLFRVFQLMVLMNIWFIASILEADEVIKRFLNGVDFYFRCGVMKVWMIYKLVGHKTRVTIQEHITYFPPNERPSKTREKSNIYLRNLPLKIRKTRLDRRRKLRSPNVCIFERYGLSAFYHLNYCYYFAYLSIHCLVVPFANFGCAWYFRTWNL